MSRALVGQCARVRAHGGVTRPRGLPTLELLGEHIVIDDPVRYGLPIKCGRKLNTKLAAIEGAQMLAGASFPELAIRLAPALGAYADEDPLDGRPVFMGAYGPRISLQLAACEWQLRGDRDCRQAVVSLWRERDRESRWKDRPCTTELQYLLRDGRLVAFTYMRSNDAWKGFSYDVFQFGQAQALLAHVLGFPTGEVHHVAASFHLYDTDVDRSKALELEGANHTMPRAESFLSGPPWHELSPMTYRSVAEGQLRFRDLLRALQRGDDPQPRNKVEAWYAERLVG